MTKCQKERCVHYCTFLLNLLEDNPGLVNKLTMSDEAYFHLIATVKRKNFSYQSTENPCELYQWPIHRRKVTMLYTVSTGFTHFDASNKWTICTWTLMVTTRLVHSPHHSHKHGNPQFNLAACDFTVLTLAWPVSSIHFSLVIFKEMFTTHGL